MAENDLPEGYEQDPARAARGCVYGIALGTLLWAVGIAVVWIIFGGDNPTGGTP